MGYVTKDQIEQARQVDILDYVLSNEPTNLQRIGSGYRLKDHESLAITTGKWYWHSHGFGGRTALDYLTDVRGYDFIAAVCALTRENPIERGQILKSYNTYPRPPTQPTTPYAEPPSANQEERFPFVLPLRNDNNKHVIAYLQSRGIDKDLVLECIKRGTIYESRPYHNVIFVGKDATGKARFATQRGTTSGYKRDATGSDKRYGFVLPPANPISQSVAVFEAPIDCLSHVTLCTDSYLPPFNGWRLSLGGTSILALEQFLKNHNEVIHCLICTDRDEAGEIAAAKISEIPGITSERCLPITGKDWNDALQAIRKEERTINKAFQTER